MFQDNVAKKDNKQRSAKAIVFSYCLISAVLSSLIITRFFLPPNFYVQSVNVLMYFVFFQGLPLCAFFILVVEAITRNSPLKLYTITLFFLYILIFVWFLKAYLDPISPFAPDYLLFWIPLIIALVLTKKSSLSYKILRRKKAILVVTVIVVFSILPFASAAIGEWQILNTASTIKDASAKAYFINNKVTNTIVYGYIGRAETDFTELLLCGSGECGETAMANMHYMQEVGLDVREVVIPGEHSFVEVNIDGEWLIPTSSGMINMTTLVDQRLADPGSLSYMIALEGNSFVELTSQYVPTDTIKIVVTQNGEPLVNAQVFLIRSGVLSAQLPDAGRYFYTDVNGTVTLHLGKPNFNGIYQNTDKYYQIYVNGQKTPYTVTSTGNGTSRIVNVPIK